MHDLVCFVCTFQLKALEFCTEQTASIFIVEAEYKQSSLNAFHLKW